MLLRVVVLLLFLALPFGSLGQNGKAARARRLGTESSIVKQLASRAEAGSRPPLRGCAHSSSGVVICLRADSSDHSAVVVVSSIFINRIDWDDDDSSAKVHLFLRQQWEDSRLGYEVDPRENIHEVSWPSSAPIWTPDTYISSGYDIKVDGRRRILIEPSGHVRSSEQRIVELSSTPSSSGAFVSSRQLTLRLGSNKYPLEDVVYMWANSYPLVVPVEVSPDLLVGHLQFEHAVAGDCVGNYSIGVYSCIDVVVTFKGSGWDGLGSIFLPTFLLVVFSWLHMWLHGSWSVPRSLSAFLPFVIIAAYLLFSPAASRYSTGWLVFCLVLTFFSLLEYFVVICCGVRRSTLRTVPGSGENEHLTHKDHVVAESSSRCNLSTSPIDVICRLVFPVIFLIFTLLFFFVLN